MHFVLHYSFLFIVYSKKNVREILRIFFSSAKRIDGVFHSSCFPHHHTILPIMQLSASSPLNTSKAITPPDPDPTMIIDLQKTLSAKIQVE